jgi:hypothetical protein
MRITAQQMIDALQDTFDVRSYSGRGMYGANCVGIDVEGFGEIMKMAAALIDYGIESDVVFELGETLNWDSMGHGKILYWPSLRLTDEEHQRLTAKELDADEEED